MRYFLEGNSALIGAIKVIILWMLVILSAFEVAHVSYLCRERYALIAVAESNGNRLKAEYGSAILELSTWGSFQRVEEIAKEDLGMHNPAASETIIVKHSVLREI